MQQKTAESYVIHSNPFISVPGCFRYAQHAYRVGDTGLAKRLMGELTDGVFAERPEVIDGLLNGTIEVSVYGNNISFKV